MALTGVVRCARTGKPLQGVPMTDGKHIVKTDQNGFYTLPGWERARMLYADVLTNAHDDWYHAIEADRDVYDFALELAQTEGAHGFMHMSDTEINGETEEDCAVWTAFVREKAKENRLAFIIHGGDIFGEIGLPKHYRIMNSRNMECPVRYCIGNHDFRGSGYGESLYEEFYGPTWYSFDCGNVHYVVTSIGHGDRPSGYVLEDQWNWLLADLKQKDPDKGLIIFNHGGCLGRFMTPEERSAEFYINEKGREELLLAYGLMGIVFGHRHINYHGDTNGIHYICTNNPKMGGIDASATGVHIVNVDGQKKLTSRMVYFDERKYQKSEGALWSVKLPGQVLHSTPLVYENTLLVGLTDDGWPKKSGVVRLNAEGKQLWFFPTKNSVKNDVAAANGTVFAQDCDGNVYAIDAETGAQKWQTKVPLGTTFYSHRCVSVYSGRVFAGGAQQFSALDMETGAVLWSSNGIGSEEAQPSANRPVFYKDLIIVGALWHRIFALDIHTGEEVWEWQPDGRKFFYATPLVAGDNLIVPACRTIYILDPAKGILRDTNAGTQSVFQQTAGLDTSGQPVLDGETLYIGTVDNGVLALDGDTFTVQQHYPVGKCLTYTSGYSRGDHGTVDGHVLVDDRCIHFAASDGYLYTYQKNTGLLIDRQRIGVPSFVAAVRFGGGIATADLMGNVTVFPKS